MTDETQDSTAIDPTTRDAAQAAADSEEATREKQARQRERLDKAEAELLADEQTGLTADFDEMLEDYRRQEENKPFTYKLGGRVFEVPRTCPTDFTFFYLRHCVEKRGDRVLFKLPTDRLDEFFELMFGPGFGKALAGKRVDMGFVLERIVPEVLSKWELDIKRPAGKADAPQTRG